jgi:hypothetical protein
MEENMRASTIHTMSRSIPAALVGASLAVGIATSARANVITDWDEKAVAIHGAALDGDGSRRDV